MEGVRGGDPVNETMQLLFLVSATFLPFPTVLLRAFSTLCALFFSYVPLHTALLLGHILAKNPSLAGIDHVSRFELFSNRVALRLHRQPWRIRLRTLARATLTPTRSRRSSSAFSSMLGQNMFRTGRARVEAVRRSALHARYADWAS